MVKDCFDYAQACNHVNITPTSSFNPQNHYIQLQSRGHSIHRDLTWKKWQTSSSPTSFIDTEYQSISLQTMVRPSILK
ncbi:hypothetical protein LIER_17778 [Lithospermum erythrorhizon]|uniref:Uncharacterized protein n=1 Tax=Lithospermum erythrorhizon TaxID=34254 RepID=A0AAV3QCY0_LITER